MLLPLSFRQENWVLQSASADQPNPPIDTPILPEAIEAHTILSSRVSQREALQNSPRNLVLARAINQLNPKALRQPVPNWWSRPSRIRAAFLLPGELRCLERSKDLLMALQKRGDLFICTTKKYETEASDLQPKGIAIVEKDANLQIEDSDLPVGSMRQWHKLAVCCQLMLKQESQRGRLYTHLIKIRSDYFYLQPELLMKELAVLNNTPNSGLIGSSDKVFAGERNTMLQIQWFWKALWGHFLDRSATSWPLNVEPILKGDESAKWYGLGFPERLVGQPKSVEELRKRLIQGGPRLSKALSQQWQKDEALINFFPGHPRFPSEVAFARFLNFNGIPLRNTESMSGFLYSDRSQ